MAKPIAEESNTDITPQSPPEKKIKMGPVPTKRECERRREQIAEETSSRIEEHGY